MSIHVLNPKAKFPPNIEKESLHEKDDVKDWRKNNKGTQWYRTRERERERERKKSERDQKRERKKKKEREIEREREGGGLRQSDSRLETIIFWSPPFKFLKNEILKPK
jgi:hypothetical protein